MGCVAAFTMVSAMLPAAASAQDDQQVVVRGVVTTAAGQPAAGVAVRITTMTGGPKPALGNDGPKAQSCAPGLGATAPASSDAAVAARNVRGLTAHGVVSAVLAAAGACEAPATAPSKPRPLPQPWPEPAPTPVEFAAACAPPATAFQRGALSDEEQIVTQTKTAADGTYELRVKPGRYNLVVGTAATGFARARLVVEAGKPLQKDVKLSK
jgi:5-hydroxyisourate hydrolase-like protein (transthyretin family)